MPARQEFRDRDDVEVDILDALVARRHGGMTVFELRSHVDVDIEALEAALNELHDDGLIEVDDADYRSVILPADQVVPADPSDEPGGVGQSLRRGIDRVWRWLHRRY